MTATRPLLCLAALTTLASCASIGSIPTSELASASLISANGTPAGKLIVAANGDEVTVNLAVVGLSQGVHGVHLHMAGQCDGPGFTSAGGHLNPANHQHGMQNPMGSHLGDLPNLTVNSLGTGTLVAKLSGDRASIEAALFDADGTAIVVHASPDDYKTDPSGNSGTRIACGVLRRT